MAKFQPVKLAFSLHEPSKGADDNLSPVIFCHGLTLTREYWGNTPQKIADATGRKVYAIDARNHGDTEWSDDWNFEIVAKDLIHFIESHGIRKAILVGHSMGGITSAKVAVTRPDLVEKIILEDTLIGDVPEVLLTSVLAFVSLIRKGIESAPAGLDEAGVRKHSIEYVIQNLPPEMVDFAASLQQGNHEPVIPLRRLANGRYTHKVNLAVIERVMGIPGEVMIETKGTFEGPALIITGTRSDIVLKEADMKQYFPKAVFEAIEGASHMVHADKPQEFANVLLKFIS